MSYKGFTFASTNIVTLLTKLNGYVVATNLDNLSDLKIYKSATFDIQFPNLFTESTTLIKL